MILGVAAIRRMLDAAAGGIFVLAATVLFYEGVPLGPARDIPVFGTVAAALLDGRVDRAARRAKAGLVAEAEFAAAQAMARIERRLRELERDKARALAAANERFSAALAASETERENLNDQIAELLAAPVNGACVVDNVLAGRLRNR
ncbi:hypothetical protein [Oricola thermophila]|uniref:Uncharacterized protein n=1 Tax=Oricola thermophila TaxID=2742145 RepID=A0A6N1VCW5_9HYPH|nr:hypothetical protein [Oricola thermophila]QKV18704.1 hypothetical protein HTY61_09710 [Oricola thermophila]